MITNKMMFQAFIMLFLTILDPHVKANALLMALTNETNATLTLDNTTSMPTDADTAIMDESLHENNNATEVVRFQFRFGFFEDDKTPKLENGIELEDLKGVVCQTEVYLTTLARGITGSNKISIQASEIDWDFFESPLELHLYFTLHAFDTEEDAAVDEVIMMNVVNNLGTDELTNYIIDYVWKAEPLNQNFFSNVNQLGVEGSLQAPVQGEVESMDCPKMNTRFSFQFALLQGVVVDGEYGIPPEQVVGVVCQTESFLTALIQETTKTDSISVFARNIDWGYDALKELPIYLNFTIQYYSSDPLAPLPEEDVLANAMLNLGPDGIQRYITQYVWNSEPFFNSIFYNVVRLKFHVIDPAEGRMASATCSSAGGEVELQAARAQGIKPNQKAKPPLEPQANATLPFNATGNATMLDGSMREEKVLRVTLQFDLYVKPRPLETEDVEPAICKIQEFLTKVYTDNSGDNGDEQTNSTTNKPTVGPTPAPQNHTDAEQGDTGAPVDGCSKGFYFLDKAGNCNPCTCSVRRCNSTSNAFQVYENDACQNSTHNNGNNTKGSGSAVSTRALETFVWAWDVDWVSPVPDNEDMVAISFSIEANPYGDVLADALAGLDWENFVQKNMWQIQPASNLFTYTAEVIYSAEKVAPVKGQVQVFACGGTPAKQTKPPVSMETEGDSDGTQEEGKDDLSVFLGGYQSSGIVTLRGFDGF